MKEHIRSSTRRDVSRSLKNIDTKESDTSFGNAYATVTDEEDGEEVGRIRVRLEYMKGDEQTPWIPPLGGFQGNGFGSTFDIPSKGDKVRIHTVLGNVHNMAYTPVFYHPSEQSSMTSAPEVLSPLGFTGKYDATKPNRRNIWRSMSGWIVEMIEGSNIAEKWHAVLQSPTARDMIRWFVPGHVETERPASVVFVKVDDLMEFWDETSPDGQKAVFRWEYLLKLIDLQMHKGGRIVINDHEGSSLSWDDKTQQVEFKMPKKKLFLKDRIGGNFIYDSEKSKITMKIIDNIEIIADKIKMGATSEFVIRVATPVIPDAVNFDVKIGIGGKFRDTKKPIIPPIPGAVVGQTVLKAVPGKTVVGGDFGLPVARLGDQVLIIDPISGPLIGYIISGSPLVDSA